MRAMPLLLSLCLALPASAAAAPAGFVNEGLVAVGRIPSDARDRTGDTLGGMGGGMALMPGSWRRTANGYTATLIMLPDRGYNVRKTVNYRARLQRFALTLRPLAGKAKGGKTGLTLTYRSTMLLTDPAGRPTTGLNPDGIRPAANGLPMLPTARGHVTLNNESLALPGDGTAWVGDEYGPYIYHYDARGRMIGAIRPPLSFLPIRGGRINFSAKAPGPDTGRENNHGFEGMSVTPDGRYLFAVTQTGLIQDEDSRHPKTTRRYVRLLQYDIAARTPRLMHEYVVPLPLYRRNGKMGVTMESELHALDAHHFLLLCRDKAGYGSKIAASVYRNITVLDTTGATDISGREHGVYAVAPGGKLRAGIVPAKVSGFIDMDDNAQLARFGLHNGAPNDAANLSVKWEGMTLAPTGKAGEYFLFVSNDNDFITQDGMMVGRPYKDRSGLNIDTRVLVYRVKLPEREAAFNLSPRHAASYAGRHDRPRDPSHPATRHPKAHA